MNPCPFCDLVSRKNEDLIVLRTPNVFVVPALKQRRNNRGHMLVPPVRHLTRMVDIESSLLSELYATAWRVGTAARKIFGATGLTLLQNDDAPDQVLFHAHIHVIPRSAGDDFKIPDTTKEELGRAELQRQVFVLRMALTA